MDGKLLIEKLLRYAKTFLHLEDRDEIYMRNLLLREFRLTEPLSEIPDLSYIDGLDVPDEIVAETEKYAVENGLTTEAEKELYSGFIMGILTPMPSVVNREFNRLREEKGIERACEYLYGMSVKNDYVKKTAISKNLKWDYKDGDNVLEITVNLSKPEKDNKEIAKLLTVKKSSDYPKCRLCKENEGFAGNLTYPARENIRTVSVTLAGEPWFVQYSPYAYFNEHLIAVSEEHAPMRITPKTIDKTLDFVDIFPNYIIGSNAALPIVGGSILNHEHYQGGGHLMPMHKSGIRTKCRLSGYPDVEIGIAEWYNSVVRLSSANREKLAEVAKSIVLAWEKWTDESVYVFSETDGVPHNTLSPVARKTDKGYIMDMILRNNITNAEYPDGVFHAHPEYHNIKKEGIGLIEAMGLYILPGRLKRQLKSIADILSGKAEYDKAAINTEGHDLYAHRNMIADLIKENAGKNLSDADAENVVRNRVNEVCKNILINTAVFKNDKAGQNGFKRFLASVGIMAE